MNPEEESAFDIWGLFTKTILLMRYAKRRFRSCRATLARLQARGIGLSGC